MAYKTILFSLNEIDRLPQLLAAAKKLGTMFNAHISGLYVVPAAQIYPTMGYTALPDMIDSNRRFYSDRRDRVKAAFEKAMKAEGTSFDFNTVDSATPVIGNDVMAQGRNADLIVVSATDRNSTQGVEYDFVERLIISAGRPVLILPFVGSAKLDFDEILVGWDGGREAARAVFDALPLLQGAKRVRIIGIDEARRGEVPAASIAEALARQRVKTEITSISSDGPRAGEALLQAANDHGAGLLVVGAYGHSRFSEFIFGGVTRHVIHQLDRPVLMSH
jgi:nucleotide-binding universal stress UspA family protein